MSRKLFAGGAFAAVAVMALLLVQLGQNAKPAEAVVNGLSTNITTSLGLNDSTGVITIDADEGVGNLRILVTGGSQVNLLGSPAGTVATADLTIADVPPTVVDGIVTVPGAPCTDCFPGIGFTGGAASIIDTDPLAPVVLRLDDNNDGVAGPAVPNVNVYGYIGGGAGVDVLADGTIDVNGGGAVEATDDMGAANYNAAYAGGAIDTFQVSFITSATVPGTNTVTVIQGASTKVLNIIVRGNVADFTFAGQSGAPVAGAATCAGFAARTVLVATGTASGGATTANFCGIVKDSAGNNIPGQPVVITTTANGTVNQASTTTNGNGLFGDSAAGNPVTITASPTGLAGTKATVTGGAGAVTKTLEFTFAGNNTSCTLTTTPSTLQVGGSVAMAAEFKDSTGGPVADGQAVTFVQVNPGAGANAAVIGAGPFNTSNGRATGTMIAAIAGAIAINASVGSGAVNCSATVIATGIVATATPGGTTTPGGGTGTIISGSIPLSGGFGLIVFGGGTVAQLVTASGCPAATAAFWATSAGAFVTYIPGTTIVVVNAAFLVLFPGGNIPANTPLVGKCV